MCIYFVNHYHCGHYADLLAPTILSHCQTYDTCLRYWHDQIYYQPLEATHAEFGTLLTPQPCRPIWPITFPGNAYLPIPIPGPRKHPRGLARPRDDDVPLPEAGPQEEETPIERFNRESHLLNTMGTHRDVVTHQEYQTRLSIAEETRAYQASHPNTDAQSVRVAGLNPGLPSPPYPLAFVHAIMAFHHARGQPGQVPNVVITPQPSSGCQRTIHNGCLYNYTTTFPSPFPAAFTPPTPQCPFLLALRTPWLYPRDHHGLLTHNKLPAPHHPASALANFRNRGGAVSNHTEKDPTGSELIRVALHTDGITRFIEPALYQRLLNGVPEGPSPPMPPGQNVFAVPFAPGEQSQGVMMQGMMMAPRQPHSLRPLVIEEEPQVVIEEGYDEFRVRVLSGGQMDVGTLAERATARWLERLRRDADAQAEAAAEVAAITAATRAWVEREEEAVAAADEVAEQEVVEEEVEEEGAPEGEPSGYRHPVGFGAVDWVSEGAGEADDDRGVAMGRRGSKSR